MSDLELGCFTQQTCGKFQLLIKIKLEKPKRAGK